MSPARVSPDLKTALPPPIRCRRTGTHQTPTPYRATGLRWRRAQEAFR